MIQSVSSSGASFDLYASYLQSLYLQGRGSYGSAPRTASSARAALTGGDSEFALNVDADRPRNRLALETENTRSLAAFSDSTRSSTVYDAPLASVEVQPLLQSAPNDDPIALGLVGVVRNSGLTLAEKVYGRANNRFSSGGGGVGTTLNVYA